MINRILFNRIMSSLHPGKVVVLLGARRVGKTFLIKEIMNKVAEPYLFLNGEEFSTRELLERRTVKNYQNILGDKKLLIIDEAQKIPEIGSILKLMVDEIENLKIIATGSSAFDLQNTAGEPLTGRKITLKLYPLSEKELYELEPVVIKKDSLQTRLVFGNYPESCLMNSFEDKSVYLNDLITSYLLKDILTLENIKNSSKIINLLRLVAFQIGGEVSLYELAKQLQLSRNTVEKYLDLLTKVFILFKLEGYSRNLRKEVVKSSKWYFYDNGIRNAIIANLNPLNLRHDVGALWENYIISERIKFQSYNGMTVNNYFWRTYDQQEIDLVEEREGNLFAFEMKWKESKIKIPTAWKKAYPDSQFKVITQENYFDWIKK
ncbi:MAG: ATP-binding protein [Ignavibacteriaceae bacterium]